LRISVVISVAGIARLRRILMAVETGYLGNSAGVTLAVAGLTEPDLIIRLMEQIRVSRHVETIRMGEGPVAIPAAPHLFAIHFAKVALGAGVGHASR
jgi:hypothetical protein